MNYDHQAIRTAAARPVRAEHAGPPSGDARPQRRPAERDGLRREAGDPRTHQAVEAVRRHGIQVESIAIADYRSEAIFGRRHVVKFTDLGSLAGNMRVLLTRIVRRAAGHE